MTNNGNIDNTGLKEPLPENNSSVSDEFDPCLDQIKSEERSKNLQQAKDTVGRMLRYAVANPNIALTDEILNNGVLSLCKKNEDYTSADEVLLWKVYSELSRLISPATDMSIQIADGLKDTIASTDSNNQNGQPVSPQLKILHFFGLNSSMNKLVKRCYRDLTEITFYLLILVSLYVVTQCYIALLSDTLTHTAQLLSNRETLQASERLINDQTPKSQSEQIYATFDILNTQLSASSQALIDLTRPLDHTPFFSLSDSTLDALGSCSIRQKQEHGKLLACIALEREYASSIYTVLSRYVLPLILGFVGATAYVTRHTLFRLSTNSYIPSPRGMLSMRLCLGGLLGAISGIFISSGANETEGFNISLTLAALVMGYSVDVAFSLFDSAIDRLKAWTKGLRESSSMNPSSNDLNNPS